MILRAVAVALAGLLGLSAPMGGSGSAQAATLDVRGGILFGARGVLIGGRSFDVQFIDGSCTAIFNGCDSASDLDFTDLASGFAAAEALGNQVVIDSGGFQFDTVAGLINGCPATFCSILIPTLVRTGGLVDGASFFNSASFDASGSFGGGIFFDTGTSGTDVYADFAPSVPVPAALPLMLGGLGVLALVGRRRGG